VRQQCSFYLVLLSVLLNSGCTTEIVTPSAAMFDGDAGGCGDFHVYRYNSDRTVAVFVGVDARDVPIDGTTMELEIEGVSGENRIRAGVYQWAKPTGEYFCDDVAGDPEPIAQWEAQSGRISATRTMGSPPTRVANATHQATVVLENLVLVNSATGEKVILDRVELPSIWVGWLAG